MKSVVVDPAAPAISPTPSRSSQGLGPRLTRRAPVAHWKWGLAACLFLAVSGGLRFYREEQFRTLADSGAVSPFPLSEFPKQLGEWEAVEGTDVQLDPQVARVAGSSDHILRAYSNARTGQTASVLILYGLAATVFGHTPQACYPAAGYQAVLDASEHRFTTEDQGVPGTYREAFYAKSVGGFTQYVEVIHAFLHRGKWVPELASEWKSFRYHPGCFKVQIQRPTSDLSTETSPSESLLREIARQIEARVDEARKNATAPAASGPRG